MPRVSNPRMTSPGDFNYAPSREVSKANISTWGCSPSRQNAPGDSRVELELEHHVRELTARDVGASRTLERASGDGASNPQRVSARGAETDTSVTTIPISILAVLEEKLRGRSSVSGGSLWGEASNLISGVES